MLSEVTTVTTPITAHLCMSKYTDEGPKDIIILTTIRPFTYMLGMYLHSSENVNIHLLQCFTVTYKNKPLI